MIPKIYSMYQGSAEGRKFVFWNATIKMSSTKYFD